MGNERPRSPRLKPRTWSLLAAAALGIVAIAFLREVFLILLIALVIAYILDPLIGAMVLVRVAGRPLPRWIAVVTLYAVLLGGIVLAGQYAVPRLASELASLATEAPAAFQRARREWIPSVEREIQQRMRPYLGTTTDPGDAAGAETEGEGRRGDGAETGMAAGGTSALRVHEAPDGGLMVDLAGVDLEVERIDEDHFRIHAGRARPPSFDLSAALGAAARDVVHIAQSEAVTILALGRRIVSATIATIFGTLVTLMITAYLLVDKDRIIGFVRVLFPPRLRPQWETLFVKLERGLAGVLRGQLLICLVNGVLSGIGFSFLDLPYWPLLTLIATVLSIIPVFGAIISSIPAIAMGLTVSWQIALMTLAWILLIHAIEAYFLNPRIIGTAARIHPVLVLAALAAGERTYGLIGALLAVPFASIIQTLFVFLRNRAYHEETEPPRGSDEPEAGASEPPKPLESTE